MSNTWLRLWHDMPNDPKFKTISRVSKQPISLVLSTYLHLLVTASQNVTRGHTNVTIEDLASALDTSNEAIEAVFEAMQGRVLEGNKLSGWSARQPKKEDAGNAASGAKSSAERKQLQREREKLDTPSKESHDLSRQVTTDKDKDKDKEIKSITPKVPNGFSEFWQAYPKKVSKADAVKAWEKLKPSEELKLEIIAAIASAQKDKSWTAKGGEFIPYPASWLNGKRWEDVLDTPPVLALVDNAKTKRYFN